MGVCGVEGGFGEGGNGACGKRGPTVVGIAQNYMYKVAKAGEVYALTW